MATFRMVALHSITAPQQPLRHGVDSQSLRELADSIATVGLIEPLIVKEVANGYEVVAGHRRLLACRAVGLATVPCLIRGDSDEVEKAVMLAENVLRADLSPVEEARALEAMRTTLGRTITQIAEGCSKSEAWVRGRLELLTWPPAVLEALQEGRANVSALRPLMDLENEVERDRLLQCAIESGATAAVTRAWALQSQGFASASPDAMGGRSAGMLPIQDVVVSMPCWMCRESHNAFALGVVRICAPCVEEAERQAARG